MFDILGKEVSPSLLKWYQEIELPLTLLKQAFTEFFYGWYALGQVLNIAAYFKEFIISFRKN